MSAGEVIPIREESDVFQACNAVRRACSQQGLNRVETEKLVTAVSEIARNQLVHARCGWVQVSPIDHNGRSGVQVEAVDQGPGISDLSQALDKASPSRLGLGLGLGSARDLVDHFEIASNPGHGTRVHLVQWSRGKGQQLAGP